MFSVRTLWGSVSIIIVDATVCYLCFQLIIMYLPGSSAWLNQSDLPSHFAYVLFTIMIILSLALTRLYSFMEYIYPVDLLKRIIPAFFLSFVSIATLGFIVETLTYLHWRLFPPLVAIFVCLFAFRYVIFYMLPSNRERILMLGASSQAREIIDESVSKKFRGYEIAGIATSLQAQVGKDFHGVPVLGLIDQLAEIVQEHAIDKIVVTLRERRGKLPVRELLRFKVAKIRVMESSTFLERVKRKLIIDEFLKPSWFIFEEGFFYTSLHGSIKRWQGLVVSFLLLTLLSPILLLVALCIKLESRGPIFFRQERVGLNGRVYRLLKFRSMYQDAEKLSGPVFTQKEDPRITRAGKIIRKTRLDEVPQFINIFKGDMNLVGPRPERPVFVDHLDEAVPYYNLRHTVRPGLTGWAQVNYKYGDSFEDGKEKLQYDLYYIKNASWYLDLLIIFLTFREVLFGKGQ